MCGRPSPLSSNQLHGELRGGEALVHDVELASGAREREARRVEATAPPCLAWPRAAGYAPDMSPDRSPTPPRRYALQSLFGPGQDGMVSHTPHAADLGIRVGDGTLEVGSAVT